MYFKYNAMRTNTGKLQKNLTLRFSDMLSSPSTSTNSGKSFLPDCWNDDVRMNNLMSAFRSQEVNPLDWSSKLAFWSDLIESSCELTGNPVFSLSVLRERFRRKGVIPVGLSTVLENMRTWVKDKSIATQLRVIIFSTAKCQSLESYAHHRQGWIFWGYKTFVKNPVTWLLGWNQKSSDTEEFVLPTLIKVNSWNEIQLSCPKFNSEIFGLENGFNRLAKTLWSYR